MSTNNANNIVLPDDNLEPKKRAAIAALLMQPSIAKAAQSVGISEKTLWRWMQNPEFELAYEYARHQMMVQTISLLHKATGAAVAALVRNLKCGNPSVEVRAAIGVLEQTYKGREHLETEARLQQIERLLEETEAARPRPRAGYRG